MKSNTMRFFEQFEQFEQELMQCMLFGCAAKNSKTHNERLIR